MKFKFLVVFLVLTMSAVCSFSQKTSYSPYISAGASVSSGVITYGAELGVYNDKAWFAVGASEYQLNDKSYWTGSFKTYLKIKSYGTVDLFGYNSVNISIDKSKALGFEPGFVTVFNISKRFAPQFSLTAPVSENTNFKFSTLSAGLSLNFWIK